ncbi:MAG: hypothetical protein FD180_2228 [Planctomycetota bacterium]|nr:MAG: hypothetical protein FD180_2228 [Planctomycetota bacterium]
MRNAEKLDIRFELLIKAKPATVWRLLTEPAQIIRWSYMATVTVDRLAPGGTFVFGSPTDKGGPDTGRIVRVEMGKRLTYWWKSSEPEETLVEYALKPEGHYTRLIFRNRGFAEGGPWADFYERDFTGWLEMHVVMKRLAERRPAKAGGRT